MSLFAQPCSRRRVVHLLRGSKDPNMSICWSIFCHFVFQYSNNSFDSGVDKKSFACSLVYFFDSRVTVTVLSYLSVGFLFRSRDLQFLTKSKTLLGHFRNALSNFEIGPFLVVVFFLQLGRKSHLACCRFEKAAQLYTIVYFIFTSLAEIANGVKTDFLRYDV